MPWVKKEDIPDVPDELKGLTKEQIQEIVNASKAAQTAQQEVTTLKERITGRDTEFQTLQNQFNETKSRLDQIERGRQPNQQPRQSAPDEIPSVVEDEEEAFRRRQAPVTAVAFHSGALTARLMAENQIRQQGQSKIFDKYHKEIDEIMAKEAPERRIFPEVWLNAFTYVKGQHFDEVVQSAQKGENLFFSETPSNDPTPPVRKTDDKLTEQELAIAKKMRVEPKRYLEVKNNINADSEEFTSSL
jgi:hypothetical protein